MALPGSAEADNYLPGGKFYRGPFVPQQQRPQLQYSIPTGGFMGQNRTGGRQSSINIYKTPPKPLTPEEEEEQRFQERLEQYQRDQAEFNLTQREAELQNQRAGAEEIASGKFMLGGKAVSRKEINQYQQKSKQAAARVRADNPVDPFYMRAKQYIAQNEPPPRPQMPGESQEQYSARVQRYAGQQQNRARRTNQVYNQMKENALIRSIQQFRDDPSGYLMGGGMSGQRTKTIAPDELMNYLGKANQMFQLTGGEGNFIDNLLGRNPEGTVQKRVVTPLSRLLPRKRSADELADFEYSRFLKNNTITSSKGTRNITEKDKTKFLQSLLGRIPN